MISAGATAETNPTQRAEFHWLNSGHQTASGVLAGARGTRQRVASVFQVPAFFFTQNPETLTLTRQLQAGTRQLLAGTHQLLAGTRQQVPGT